MIYLNTHWQLSLGSAVVRETSPLAEPPVMDFTDAVMDYTKNENKMLHFFVSPILCVTNGTFSKF